jgi:hypothetical protein
LARECAGAAGAGPGIHEKGAARARIGEKFVTGQNLLGWVGTDRREKGNSDTEREAAPVDPHLALSDDVRVPSRKTIHLRYSAEQEEFVRAA